LTQLNIMNSSEEVRRESITIRQLEKGYERIESLVGTDEKSRINRLIGTQTYQRSCVPSTEAKEISYASLKYP